MRIIKVKSDSADVQFSVYELTVFRNALTEVYNSLPKSEFETRMGLSREEIKRFSSSILQIIKKLNKNSEIQLQLSFNDILTLNDTLNEVCHGFKVNNFEQKIGMTKQEVQVLLSSLNKLGKQIKSISKISNFVHDSTKKTSHFSVIRKKCYLETNEYQIIFYLKNIENCKNDLGLIIVLKTKLTDQDLFMKSSAKKVEIRELQNLIKYLEYWINYFPQNNNESSTFFSLDDNIFQIQVLSKSLISEKEFLNFCLRLNVISQKDKDKKDNYLEVHAEVSFDSIYYFTSSIQEFLVEIGFSS